MPSIKQEARSSFLRMREDRSHVPSWKRALDMGFVVMAIPLLVPLLAIIAALIKCHSKGPLLFRQERIGQAGATFQLYKFRTMQVGSATIIHEAHTSDLIASNKPMAKLDATDARLIPYGGVLRATGLDELPQLINVLRGEMSIVGPRPCIPSEYTRYSGAQIERFNTPPGLTGLWQVSGKNRLTFTEMVELDIDYSRRRSLALDLWIIALTLPAILNEVQDFARSWRKREVRGDAALIDFDRERAH